MYYTDTTYSFFFPFSLIFLTPLRVSIDITGPFLLQTFYVRNRDNLKYTYMYIHIHFTNKQGHKMYDASIDFSLFKYKLSSTV